MRGLGVLPSNDEGEPKGCWMRYSLPPGVFDRFVALVGMDPDLTEDGAVDFAFAKRIADAITPDRFIAAVDSRGGNVVVDGWRTTLSLTPVEAARALEPYAAEFLYTHVDREGLMLGTDMGAIEAVRKATTRRLTAAGGITTIDEVNRLDAMGVDAVVGMAIYTGRMSLSEPPPKDTKKKDDKDDNADKDEKRDKDDKDEDN